MQVRNRMFGRLLAVLLIAVLVVGFVPAPKAQAANELIPDGDYVIWAPAYNVALSATYGGYYNVATPVAMVGNTLTGYDDDDIWTVKNNPDGTLTITHDGQKLAMGSEFSSLTLDEVHDKWRPQTAGNGLIYLKNTVRGCYVEYYQQKGYWSGYSRITNDTTGMFALQFTPVVKGHETVQYIRRSIALWEGSFSQELTALTEIPGELFPGLEYADETAALTVIANGESAAPYAKGYLGGNVGAAEGDLVEMTFSTLGWGDVAVSFQAKSKAGSYQAYRVCWSADGETFLDLGNGALTPGQEFDSYAFELPALAEDQEKVYLRLEANGSAQAGSDLQLSDITVTASPIVEEGRVGFVTVNPSSEFAQQKGMPLTMSCATEGAEISYRINGGQWQTYDESNKPVIGDLPMGLEVKATREDMVSSAVSREYYRAGAVQSVTLSVSGTGVYIPGDSLPISLHTGTEGATIYYATSKDGLVFGAYQEYTQPLNLEKGFGAFSIRAYAQKPGFDDSAVITHTYTERASERYNIYFGQLHSHTTISDGAGHVEEAFRYAHEAENLDFLAVTDHSNSFDNANSGVISVNSAASVEWQQGHKAADSVTDGTFVGIYGYEMTWSNGLGHMNTFNTPGWQSRTQGDYAQYATAIQNYYAALATVPESFSQFNHPGTTFGDFSDFGYYSQVNDDLVTLVEVGNGSGAIGSSGYFPSYEYYTRALDKGWHVAPSNNQDNHRGMWGDSNTARTVALADDLTRESIYDALRNYRVYATEDNDLHIYYTLNGQLMGSVIPAQNVGEELSISVDLSDATDSVIGKVEVIVNGGLSIAQETLEAAEGTVNFTVPAEYDYYYLRITQADGDIAVTAPVWVGQVEAVGIAGLKTEKPMTLTEDKQHFSMELYNNEAQPLFISSIVLTDETTGEVIHTEENISSVPNTGTALCEFDYAFQTSGLHKITATVMGVLGSEQRSYTTSLELMVMPGDMVNRIVVDGTHANDYVSGYYAGKVNNMARMAASMNTLVHVETEEITSELLANCDLLVVSAPAKKTENGYTMSVFEPEFLEMVAEYVKNGGSVVVCGMADYQDHKNDGIHETSVQMNSLLEAMGSTLRINDDEAMDEVKNGGNPYRLYPTTLNMDSPWMDNIRPGQQYSQYGGSSVDPGEGTWLVKGHSTTSAIDSDKDGDGGVRAGNVIFLACEETPYGGTIFASGGVFLSDYEIEEDPAKEGYVNQTVYQNILASMQKPVTVTPIGEVRSSMASGMGQIFVVEGYVTAGTDNKNTTFFDSAYIQDATGGICLFPFSAEHLKLGSKIRVTGYTDVFQGDTNLQVISYEILKKEEKQIQEPKVVDCAAAMDYAANGGRLLQIEGVVTAVTGDDGNGLTRFTVLDAMGNEATVFVDGYIGSATTGENDLALRVHVGAQVSCVGLGYCQPGENVGENVPVLRVRNCDEIIYLGEGELPSPESAASYGIWIAVAAVVIVLAVVMVILLKKKGKNHDSGKETK